MAWAGGSPDNDQVKHVPLHFSAHTSPGANRIQFRRLTSAPSHHNIFLDLWKSGIGVRSTE